MEFSLNIYGELPGNLTAFQASINAKNRAS